MMIEVCGKLDAKSLRSICKEILEETGYAIEKLDFIFQAYMSPGSVTEKIFFYTAAYSDENKVNSGGGALEEGEYIEVLETDLETAVHWVCTGRIKDAKTIMLLQYAEQNLSSLL